MITEDYVSFETAKLLNEKGFEYNPDESYWLIDANNSIYWISCIGAYDYVDVPTESFQRPKNGYRIVTQAVAMKWLREVHNIDIDIDAKVGMMGVKVYVPMISTYRYDSSDRLTQKQFGLYYKEDTGIVPALQYFETYEEAVEEALLYCLQNLI